MEKYIKYDRIVAKTLTNIIDVLDNNDTTFNNMILYIGKNFDELDLYLYECCKIVKPFLKNEIKINSTFFNFLNFKEKANIKKIKRIKRKAIPNITYNILKKTIQDSEEEISYLIFKEIYNEYWKKNNEKI